MNTYECAAAGQLLDSNFNDLNPYRSPAESADLVAAEVVSEVVIASSGKRLLNYFVDYFGMLAMSFVGGGIFIGLLSAAGVREETILESPALWGIVFMLVYYVPQECLFGTTLGKLLTSTRLSRAMVASPQPVKS